MSSNSMDGPPIVEVDKKIDIESEGSDFYDNAAKYWEGVDGTVNGMLGGKILTSTFKKKLFKDYILHVLFFRIWKSV